MNHPNNLTMFRKKIPSICAGFWGAAVWFPVGITYLALLFTWLALLGSSNLSQRWHRAVQYKPYYLSLAFFLWVFLSYVHHPEGQFALSMLFHAGCFHVTILAALMLEADETTAVWRSFLLVGCVMLLAFYIDRLGVSMPHVSGLKDLLYYSGNKSIRAGLLISLMSLYAFIFIPSAIRSSDVEFKLSYVKLIGVLSCSCFLVTAIAVMFFIPTRTAMLILPFTLTVIILRKQFTLKRALLSVIVILTLSVAVFNFSTVAHERFEMAATNLKTDLQSGEPSSSTGLRYYFYKFSINEMLKRPILGMGPGTWHSRWSVHYPKYGWFANPHNDYLLFGSESGLPALLLLVSVYLAFLLRAMKVSSFWGSVAVAASLVAALATTVNAGMRDAVFGLSLVWLMATAFRAACADSDESLESKSIANTP